MAAELVDETGLLTPDEMALVRMPGGAMVDDDLMNEVIEELRYLVIVKGLEVALAIAECIVRSFANGDLDAFLARQDQHLSWRALAKRTAEVHCSHSYLALCVQVLAQVRQLGDDIGRSLTLTHHFKLIGVQDDMTRRVLAQRSVDERLSTRQLDEAIAALPDPPPGTKRTGRKRVKGPDKALRTLKKALAAMASTQLTAEILPPDDAEKLLALLDGVRRQVEPLGLPATV